MLSRTISTARISSFSFIATLFLIVAPPTLAQPKKQSSLSPDPKIQEIIRGVIAGMEGDGPEDRPGMRKLFRMAHNEPEVLVRQCIVFLSQAHDNDSLLMLVLVGRLGHGNEHPIRGALAPLLESNEKRVRQLTANCLTVIDRLGGPTPESNLDSYRKTLSMEKKAPPAGLINYLNNYYPQSQCLLFFGEVYMDDPTDALINSLRWSDHVISTVKWRHQYGFLKKGDLEMAQKEVATLSKHEGWFARRYVVDVINDVSDLGTPEMIERLKKDANPLVSSRAKEVFKSRKIP